MNYTTFDSYVADHPEGESFRHWLTRDTRPVWLVKGDGPHGGLPGGYLFVKVVNRRDDGIVVIVNDCDDGMLEVYVTSQEEAQARIDELLAFAPLTWKDVWDLGFTAG